MRKTKFKEVKEAYDVLSDDSKRATYDQYGHVDPNQGFGGGRRCMTLAAALAIFLICSSAAAAADDGSECAAARQ